jgi:hypothetical protein
MADKAEAKTTIVNIKGIDLDAWEAAKTAAARQDETMGEWVSRALNHLVNLEAGPREFPPNPAANLGPKTVNPGQAEALATLAGLAPALTGIGPKLAGYAAADVSRLISDCSRLARGEAPRPAAARIRNRPPAIPHKAAGLIEANPAATEGSPS